MATRCCDGCESTHEVEAIVLCVGCRAANDARLAEVKLRLSGDVDWEDVKKFGIYDRFGVPIATVLDIQSPNTFQGFMSTGPMMVTTSTQLGIGDVDDGTKILEVKELHR